MCFSFRVRGELTNNGLIFGGRDKKTNKKTVQVLLEVLTSLSEMQQRSETTRGSRMVKWQKTTAALCS